MILYTSFRGIWVVNDVIYILSIYLDCKWVYIRRRM